MGCQRLSPKRWRATRQPAGTGHFESWQSRPTQIADVVLPALDAKAVLRASDFARAAGGEVDWQADRPRRAVAVSPRQLGTHRANEPMHQIQTSAAQPFTGKTLSAVRNRQNGFGGLGLLQNDRDVPGDSRRKCMLRSVCSQFIHHYREAHSPIGLDRHRRRRAGEPDPG